ncbi:MAG: hypothetical protein P1P90_03050 [Patescibacteria group bacterium]|nr:hypothetical protein [Patescibacteria group bacterium]
MFFGTQDYGEGRYEPKCFDDLCYVWCTTRATEVLDSHLHEAWLAKNPENDFRINFANRSCARIQPGHILWEALKMVAQKYDVYVYVLTLQGGYKHWSGDADSLGAFDCILITNKGSDPPKNLIR